MMRKVLTLLNKLLPKLNHVIVQGFPVSESSAVEVANYLSDHYNLPVYFAVSSNKELLKKVGLLDQKIILLNESSLGFRLKYLTAKYLFFTHGSPLSYFSKRQTVINIWHGVLYKKVGKLIGHAGIPADITVGTSGLTREMFSEAFGVSDSKIYISGYPRNDILLRAKASKSIIKKQIGKEIASFDKILIWLPTYRKSVHGDIRVDGTDMNNPFYIENFDVTSFNQLLSDHNALCIVKPHPMAPKFEHIDDLQNLIFIDDKWILDKGITLYHLVGCTDILISDVSSIIIDYMLMDQPIVCISTDFEEYKASRGFYFKDIENWIPTKVIRNKNEFTKYVELLLLNGKDPYIKKRIELKNIFFTYQDENSTERLVKHVFNDTKA